MSGGTALSSISSIVAEGDSSIIMEGGFCMFVAAGRHFEEVGGNW